MDKPMTSAQDTPSYRHYRDLLEDPRLLDRAVVTVDGDLAIPVGGKRRGGYIGALTRAQGRRLLRDLATRPTEFPDVRLLYWGGCDWLVEWGPDLDWRGDDEHPEDYVTAGRLFGYREEAIDAYGQTQAMRCLEKGRLW